MLLWLRHLPESFLALEPGAIQLNKPFQKNKLQVLDDVKCLSPMIELES